MRKKPYKRVHIETIRKLYAKARSERRIRHNQIVNLILESSKENPVEFGKKFHLKGWIGPSRGIFTLYDHTPKFKEFLNMVNIAYVEGNDAPRGGKAGDYIQILTKIRY